MIGFRRAAGLALAAVALLPAARLDAQSAPPAADSVTLRFGWPAGTEARVHYTQVTEREGDRDEPSHIEIEGELTMHVHESPDGLVVEHLDPVVTRFGASPPFAPDDPHAAILGRLGPPAPHYLVSSEGRLIGVDGGRTLADAFAAILGPSAAQSGVLAAMTAELLNEPLLVGTARERWNALVGLWRDATLRRGESVAEEAEEGNPLVPSVVLPYVYEFEYEGMEPCDAARPDGPACARLHMISLPDPTQLGTAINRALDQAGLAATQFDGLAQRTEVELLTDPSTLLPRELTMAKVVEGILKNGGTSRVFKRLDQLRLVYTYAGG